MPRLQDLFLNSSVYLYPTEEQARDGRGSGGTGFITTITGKPPLSQSFHAYIVTAKHVLSDLGEIFIRVNRRPWLGKPVIFRTKEREWVPHRDADVAVVQVALNPVELHIAHVTEELYVTREMMAWPDDDDYDPDKLGIGDDCYFFGRFMGHPGIEKNLPMLRFGNLAMMPREPVYGEEAFLVEFKSMPGFSGSPVFIYRTGTIDFWNTYKPAEPNELRFLGVDFCHLPEIAEVGTLNDEGKFVGKKVWVKHSAGIMGVVPAWKLRELLMTEERLVKRRKEVEDAALEERRVQAAKDSVAPTLESVGGVTPLDAGDDDEYERFEDLARHLVQVPKEEIDEARKREQGEVS
jgi:hypothetical protein